MLSLHDELPIFAVRPRPAFAAPWPVPCLMAACLMAAALVGGSAQAHTAGSTGYAEVTVDGGTVSYGLSLAVDTLAGVAAPAFDLARLAGIVAAKVAVVAVGRARASGALACVIPGVRRVVQ